MKTRRVVVGLLLAAIALPAAARDSFRFGILPNLAAYKVTDPNGPVESTTGFAPLTAIMFAEAGRDGRLMFQGAYDSFSLNHSTTNIGQDVTSIRGDVSYQMLVRVTRGWKPWFGVGLGYANETYKDRYTLTSGGFLGTRYPDRTKSAFDVLINASSEWKVNKNWDMGVHLQLEQPTGSDSMRILRLGIYAVY